MLKVQPVESQRHHPDLRRQGPNWKSRCLHGLENVSNLFFHRGKPCTRPSGPSTSFSTVGPHHAGWGPAGVPVKAYVDSSGDDRSLVVAGNGGVEDAYKNG